MKRSDIIALIGSAAEQRKLCRVLFDYDASYRHCVPLTLGKRLVLFANEDEFTIDGYSVRRLRDIKKAQIKDDKYADIVRAEGILESLSAPDVDLSDWYGFFVGFGSKGGNIIIEKESSDDEECEFAIGRIVKVLSTKVIFEHFDADGVWQEEYYSIPFSQITSVTFSSRYVEIYSKYV